jgi:hypothetical protein
MVVGKVCWKLLCVNEYTLIGVKNAVFLMLPNIQRLHNVFREALGNRRTRIQYRGSVEMLMEI